MSPTASPGGLPFLLTLGGVTGLTAVTIDILLPALGPVALAGGADAADGALLVSVYFVAYALGQLFWGPLSDRIGRRPAVVAGLLLFAAVSVLCALAPDFRWLLVARFVQGFAGAVPVVARAVVRDVASGTESARLMSTLASIVAVAPLLAPALGSGLLVLFDWRAVFVFLALLALVYLVAFLRFVPETAPREQGRSKIPLRAQAAFLFASRDFVGGVLVSAAVFAGYAAVLSLGSVVAADAYGIAPEAFGPVFAIAAAFVIAGTFITRQWVRRIGLRGVGSIAMAVIAAAGVFHGVLYFAEPGFTLLWSAVALFMLGFGVVMPSATSFALEPAAGMTGFASSLLGTVQMLCGALAGWLVSLGYDGSHRVLSLAMALCALLALAVFAALRISRSRGGW